MRTRSVSFPGALGGQVAGRLDLPETEPQAFAVFASCFTCGKDINAAKRVGMALAEREVATLRFDFTGLGDSEGSFADTTFTTNCDDLKAACDYLRVHHAAPQIMVGHSLGGAAVLATARSVPEVKAVATVGAPADPTHVTHQFGHVLDDIREEGRAEVSLAGRPFVITREFLDDLHQQCNDQEIAKLGRALLVMHAPRDTWVGVENAKGIFEAAKHPKSFVSLDTADHLLTKRKDADYVATVLAAWAQRYIDDHGRESLTRSIRGEQGAVIVQETKRSRLQEAVVVGDHRLLADEPESHGGADTGPSPYDYVLSGLGACTAMTLRIYADRKAWPLESVRVRLRHDKVHASDCSECETQEGHIDRIDRRIELTGNLDDAQRQKLLEIADKCPVHRTLHSEVRVDTALAD